MKNRQILFDRNRQLAKMEEVEELRQKVAQLEVMLQQQHAFALQQQALTSQQQHNQQQQQLAANQFLQLSAKDVLYQFRQIRPLDESQYVGSFFRSVEKTFELCQGNIQLREFGLQIIKNEKIMGNAGKSIRELGEDADWEAIKINLRQYFRPRHTYGEIFNYCRMVKVSNLRELFCIFEKAKFNLNELYEFDGRQSSLYSPVNLNRDLVDILLEKIDGPVRAHITTNSTLNEVILRYSNLKLLDDFRCIDFRHRKHSNRFKSNDSNFKMNAQNNTNNDNKRNLSKNNNKSEAMNTYFENKKYSYRQQNNGLKNLQPSSRLDANNHLSNNTYRYNYSAQSRNTHKTNKPVHLDNTVEPMDITNIEQTGNFFRGLGYQRLPVITITIQNERINCLIDTGSTTSLIGPNTLNNFSVENLEKTLLFRTINGINQITSKIITPLPKEFKSYGTISWKVANLKNENYNAIIGQNVLKPFKAKIDFENDCLEINGNKLFFHQYPFDIHHIYTLKPVPTNIIQKLNLEHLNTEERSRIEKLLLTYVDLFYKEGEKLTATHNIQHEIVTTTSNPIYSKIYRYPKVHEQEINRQINEMLEQNIITPSCSPYNSPLWIVPKKTDKTGSKQWRVVIDYRKLNENTISDKFPIPNIDGILDKLGRSMYFTTLDLAKGFHQIVVRPEDRRKTAFSTPQGHFEFVRMPFGLKNAPSTFQRLMNSVLQKYINKVCVVYLDDILVFSTSLEEHLVNLKLIFEALRKAGLKIQVNKCNFLTKETEYLGHILTPQGVKPNRSKVDVIQKLKLPTTEKQIRSFLGMTGYYRKFIKDYAKVAYPMIYYLKKDRKINPNDPNYISAFEKLKSLITDHPILRYPNFNKRFKLTTDASNFALGAVLSQDGHPICFASRTLNDHEKNYATVEKELLAIVWAVHYFRPYLYGTEFDLHTDHQPLKWLQAKYNGKNIKPRLQRWLVQLGEYEAKIDYIQGKDNKIADFLSRINSYTNEINTLENQNDNISTMATIHSQQEDFNDHFPILDTIVNRFKSQIIIVERKQTEKDIVLGNHRVYIEENDIPDNISDIIRRHIKPGKTAIYSELNDSLYNTVQNTLIELFQNSKNIKFIKCSYFAKDLKSEEEVIKQVSIFHTKESGHSGIIPNYQQLKRKIYYPNLKYIINKVVNNCDICNAAKYDRNPIKKKFAITETPSETREIVHIDTYVNSKHSFIIFLDKFSKHAAAFYIEDRNNKTLIEKIRLYISLFGKMKKVVCDNEFNSVNVKQFCREEDINIHFSKPNSHTGNSDVERLNSTITERIRALNIENNIPIKDQISKAIELYNNTFHSTIQETPYNVHNNMVDKKIIKTRIEANKYRNITNANINREEYNENRSEGFIKNYLNVRHKEKPKFRKAKLKNIHESNIKRPLKFSNL